MPDDGIVLETNVIDILSVSGVYRVILSLYILYLRLFLTSLQTGSYQWRT